jgi:hypothetical protein
MAEGKLSSFDSGLTLAPTTMLGQVCPVDIRGFGVGSSALTSE